MNVKERLVRFERMDMIAKLPGFSFRAMAKILTPRALPIPRSGTQSIFAFGTLAEEQKTGKAIIGEPILPLSFARCLVPRMSHWVS
jgi:hypothetical protein